MGRPLKSPNGNTPVRLTPVKDARRPRVIARATSRLVNVAIPELMPDHLTALLRERARNADDRLERTAHRLIRGQVNQVPTNRAGPSR
jgi:hypothetical protein